MITVDIILATRPCEAYPRARVEALAARLDGTSWVRLAESCRDAGWPVSLADLRLTAARHAAAHHRATVLIPWVQWATRARVAAYRRRWPEARAEVVALRAVQTTRAGYTLRTTVSSDYT